MKIRNFSLFVFLDHWNKEELIYKTTSKKFQIGFFFQTSSWSETGYISMDLNSFASAAWLFFLSFVSFIYLLCYFFTFCPDYLFLFFRVELFYFLGEW